jgi:hypothetical protein
MPRPSTTTTSGKTGNQLTFETFTSEISPITDCSAPVFHVKATPGQDSDKDSAILEDNYSSRLSALSGITNLKSYSWKTLRDYYHQTEDESSPGSSIRFGTVGMWGNGVVSTARHSCLKIENASTLSDILEENPEEQYYLSRIATESLIKHAWRHKKKGSGFGATLLTPFSKETIRVVQCNSSSSPDPVSPKTDGGKSPTDDISETSESPCSP